MIRAPSTVSITAPQPTTGLDPRRRPRTCSARGRGAGEHPADVIGAGPDVPDRSLAAWFLGQDGVLLEHPPALIAVVLQGAHDGRDVDVATAERPVHALPYGIGIGEPPVPD